MTPADAPVACVAETADDRAGGDDDQRGDSRLLDGLAEDVDEHGHRQDRTSAAEHPEAQADRKPERYGDCSHARRSL